MPGGEVEILYEGDRMPLVLRLLAVPFCALVVSLVGQSVRLDLAKGDVSHALASVAICLGMVAFTAWFVGLGKTQVVFDRHEATVRYEFTFWYRVMVRSIPAGRITGIAPSRHSRRRRVWWEVSLLQDDGKTFPWLPFAGTEADARALAARIGALVDRPVLPDRRR